MKALLVEVDYITGWRAGDVDPRDGNLQSYGWQSLPEMPGDDVEIRVVEDDRDLSHYEDVDGVTVLDGLDEINAKIDEHIPPKYQVRDYQEAREGVGRTRSLPSDPYEERKALFEADAPGVRRRDPPKIVSEAGGKVRLSRSPSKTPRP